MSCHPLNPRVSPILLIALLLIALLAAACNERSSPTEPPPPLVSAPGAAPSTISRIEVTSPGTLAPQASVQLVALAYKGDGSVEVVSKLTRWSSEAPDVVAVTPDGLATGMRVGETRVTANFHSGRTYYGAAPVVVLIPGTYKVSGRVMDSGVPIANASVSSDGGETLWRPRVLPAGCCAGVDSYGGIVWGDGAGGVPAPCGATAAVRTTRWRVSASPALTRAGIRSSTAR